MKCRIFHINDTPYMVKLNLRSCRCDFLQCKKDHQEERLKKIHLRANRQKQILRRPKKLRRCATLQKARVFLLTHVGFLLMILPTRQEHDRGKKCPGVSCCDSVSKTVSQLPHRSVQRLSSTLLTGRTAPCRLFTDIRPRIRQELNFSLSNVTVSSYFLLRILKYLIRCHFSCYDVNIIV